MSTLIEHVIRADTDDWHTARIEATARRVVAIFRIILIDLLIVGLIPVGSWRKQCHALLTSDPTYKPFDMRSSKVQIQNSHELALS